MLTAKEAAEITIKNRPTRQEKELAKLFTDIEDLAKLGYDSTDSIWVTNKHQVLLKELGYVITSGGLNSLAGDDGQSYIKISW